ncbi:MAG: glycine cleavage T C-terminal barrel domain-containing protein, partial [Pseudomonadota bacterium]
ALHRLPALENAEVKMLLNGPEGFTPDGSFLLGEAAETRGLFLGCGMNSVGVASGGGAGMALAHCIQHGHVPMDLHEVDPKRFSSAVNSVEALTARVPEVLGKHYEISYPGRQWSTARNLKMLPLDGGWREIGAHMGQFFGWERPLYFSKTKEPKLTFGRPDWFDQIRHEVHLAHEKAAIFDQSSFGKIEIQGRDACSFLNRLCTNEADRTPGRVIYTSMLNDRGGIESDLTMIRLSDELYRLYVGTNSIKRDLAWLRHHRHADERLTITDCTLDYAVLGLMGPDADEIANTVGAKALRSLRYFWADHSEIAQYPILAARLSYVGELGFEITCNVAHALPIYEALYQAGARPAGLLAQTSMRIEKQFLAYGHELDTDISPLQAGLGFSVAWDTEFIGKPRLLAQRDQGTRGNIISVLFHDQHAVPIGNEPVVIDQKIVGKTTSAAFGHRIGAPIALASIDETSHWTNSNRAEVDIAGTLFGVDLVDGAVFDPKGLRMKRC